MSKNFAVPPKRNCPMPRTAAVRIRQAHIRLESFTLQDNSVEWRIYQAELKLGIDNLTWQGFVKSLPHTKVDRRKLRSAKLYNNQLINSKWQGLNFTLPQTERFKATRKLVMLSAA
jgi:hypothetical protein